MERFVPKMETGLEDYKPVLTAGEQFAKSLGRFKAAKHMTNEDLAETFLVSKRTIEGWLQGRSPGRTAWRLLENLIAGKVVVTRSKGKAALVIPAK